LENEPNIWGGRFFLNCKKPLYRLSISSFVFVLSCSEVPFLRRVVFCEVILPPFCLPCFGWIYRPNQSRLFNVVPDWHLTGRVGKHQTITNDRKFLVKETTITEQSRWNEKQAVVFSSRRQCSMGGSNSEKGINPFPRGGRRFSGCVLLLVSICNEDWRRERESL